MIVVRRSAFALVAFAMVASSCGGDGKSLVSQARSVCAVSIHLPVEKLGVVNHLGKRWLPMHGSGTLISVDAWDMHGYYKGKLFECLMYQSGDRIVFLSGRP